MKDSPAGRLPHLDRVTIRLGLWIAVAAVVIALLMALLNSSVDPSATLLIFTTRFLGIFIEAAPFLLLGAMVSGLLEIFVSREDLVRWIPHNPIIAPLAGAFMGFAFPVCECGVVPVTRRLFTKGLPLSVGVAFLLAAPVMNPIVLVSTFIAFGFGPVLIARFVITLIVALVIGMVFALTARPEEVLRPVSFSAAPSLGKPRPIEPATLLEVPAPQSWQVRLTAAIQIAAYDFFEMGRFLVIGSMLAAALQTFVSQEALLSLGEGPLLSVLLMQVLAFVLSVCSTVDAFLALAFSNTFSDGSIIAFLTFGPMIDIKSTLMFLGVFRRKIVLYLIVLPLLLTLLVGLWVNTSTWVSFG